MLTEAMITERKNCYNYINSLQDRLQNLTDPLHLIGIDSFSYGKVFLDNNQNLDKNFVLTNDMQRLSWGIENLTTLGIYSNIIPTDIDREKYSLLPIDSDDCIMKAYRDHFGFRGAFSIWRRHKDYGEYLTFRTTNENHSFCNEGIDKKILDLLLKYRQYFLAQIEKIDVDESNLIPYPKFNLPLKNNFSGNSDLFLKAIDQGTAPLKIKGKIVTLAKREYECLSMMAKGRTIKEIAFQLGLSPTTIITHINNLKRRTGLTCKSDLINLYYNHFAQ
jgi:DNA-binding CsgD family transcriptional regulator